MGKRAHLTRIPSEILIAVKKSGGFLPNEDITGAGYNWYKFPSVNLDKTWWILNQAFQRAGVPLKYTIEGDYSPDGGLDLFDTGLDSDSYLAYVSPEIVEQISNRLEKLHISDFLQHYGADKQDVQYCVPYFRDLVRLYREAAYNEEAMFISIP